MYVAAHDETKCEYTYDRNNVDNNLVNYNFVSGELTFWYI